MIDQILTNPFMDYIIFFIGYLAILIGSNGITFVITCIVCVYLGSKYGEERVRAEMCRKCKKIEKEELKEVLDEWKKNGLL